MRPLTLLLGFSLLAGPALPQNLSDVERGQVGLMLRTIREEIKKRYYDPSFRGMDLEARFKQAEAKLEHATTLGQAFGVVAQAVLELGDRHTLFVPPTRTIRTEYGWTMQMVGERCLVVAVRPGSDAEAKGLRVGDEVVEANGYVPSAATLWQMRYLFYLLRPQPGLRVVVTGEKGVARTFDVAAKVTQLKHIVDIAGGADFWELIRDQESESRLLRHRYYELGPDLMIWKMPRFHSSTEDVDTLMGKAVRHKALVLDLRGNPGGALATLQRLAGWFFDHDVKIADQKGRKESKPLTAKTRGRGRVFTGKLVVLVDNDSVSASELFSRLMQIEKRGLVLGDRTGGAVMASRRQSLHMGAETMVLYSVQITEADLIMTDGRSLEGVGTTPDEHILPSPADLRAGRDPVLARAVEILGGKLSPEEAGAMFPIEWR